MYKSQNLSKTNFNQNKHFIEISKYNFIVNQNTSY